MYKRIFIHYQMTYLSLCMMDHRKICLTKILTQNLLPSMLSVGRV